MFCSAWLIVRVPPCRAPMTNSEGGHSPGVDTLESFVPDGEEDEGMDSLEAARQAAIARPGLCSAHS